MVQKEVTDRVHDPIRAGLFLPPPVRRWRAGEGAADYARTSSIANQPPPYIATLRPSSAPFLSAMSPISVARSLRMCDCQRVFQWHPLTQRTNGQRHWDILLSCGSSRRALGIQMSISACVSKRWNLPRRADPYLEKDRVVSPKVILIHVFSSVRATKSIQMGRRS